MNLEVMQKKMLELAIKKHFLAVWIMEHYRRLLWELVLLLSSEVFENCLKISQKWS